MPPLLNLSSVAQAVLDLAATTGIGGVTARALANELHVSVGALYNYAGSMQHAVSAGEEILNQEILQRVLDAPDSQGAFGIIVDWAMENPGHASLFFDPSRPHTAVPRELCPRIEVIGGHDDAPTRFEDVRSWVGLEMRGGMTHLSQPGFTSDALDIVRAYDGARTVALSAERPAETPRVSVERLNEILKDVTAADAQSERAASARLVSAQLLLDPEVDRWNFRALSGGTGVALAALHGLGSRGDHISRGIIDICTSLAMASSEIAVGDRSSVFNIMSQALGDHLTHLMDDLAAVLTPETNAVLVERVAAFSQGSLAWCTPSVVNMVAAVMISAHHRRGVDVDSWTIAPRVARELTSTLAG